jgi:hypothetical protein
VALGGTGKTSNTLNSILVGNGTNAMTEIVPSGGSSTQPKFLTWDGTVNAFNSIDTKKLTDVSQTVPTNNQVLKYNTLTSKYEPGNVSSSLATLTDVSLNLPLTNGESLVYDSALTVWKNAFANPAPSFSAAYVHNSNTSQSTDFGSAVLQTVGNISNVNLMYFTKLPTKPYVISSTIGSPDFIPDNSYFAGSN